MLFMSLPYELYKSNSIGITKAIAEKDKATLDGLRSVGFGLDPGPGGAGLIAKYFEIGGGNYCPPCAHCPL